MVAGDLRGGPAALAEARAPAREIAAIGLDCTACTVIPCQNDGTPLRRALLWMDQRAYREAEEISRTADPVLRYVSGAVSPAADPTTDHTTTAIGTDRSGLSRIQLSLADRKRAARSTPHSFDRRCTLYRWRRFNPPRKFRRTAVPKEAS